MSDSLKGPAKCSGSKLNQSSELIDRDECAGLSPGEETMRAAIVAFRRAMGWSQLRAAVENDVSESTYKRYESAERHSRIPAVVFDNMRRLAHEHGLDSYGKVRVVGASR